MRLKAAITRATFLPRDSKIFYAWKSLSQSGYSHEARLASRDRVREQSPPCKLHLRFAMPIIFRATRCKNPSRPWSLTRGRFQRLESPRQSRARVNSKSYAIYESHRRNAQMLCESPAAIMLNLLHKILCLWYKIVCSAFTVINCDFDTKFTSC